MVPVWLWPRSRSVARLALRPLPRCCLDHSGRREFTTSRRRVVKRCPDGISGNFRGPLNHTDGKPPDKLLGLIVRSRTFLGRYPLHPAVAALNQELLAWEHIYNTYALTSPWATSPHTNSSVSGNINERRQSVTNHLDEYTALTLQGALP